MATPDIDTQLATLRNRIGEPSDAAQARWSTAQLLAQLNSSRNVVSEESYCYQVKDSILFTQGGSSVAPVSAALPTVGSPFLVSVVNDFIWVELLTWEGRPLRLVQPRNWADVVGADETIQSDPSVFMFFGRQLQMFGVPTVSGTLKYRGWAYPPAVVSGGADASFTVKAADVGIWHAAMALKGSDERINIHEEKQYNQGIAELKKQYKPRGARYLNTGELYLPWRPLP